MKAYKAFNPDLTCRGYQYELGKTHIHEGPIEICKSGFHACPSKTDVSGYYDIINFSNYGHPYLNRMFLVEMTGKIKRKGNKIVGQEITLIEELPLTSWFSPSNNLFLQTSQEIPSYGSIIATQKTCSYPSNRIITDQDNSELVGTILCAQNNSSLTGRQIYCLNNNTININDVNNYCVLRCGNNATIKYKDRTLTILGTGLYCISMENDMIVIKQNNNLIFTTKINEIRN